MIKTIEWNNGRVIMLDQRLLPREEIFREYTTAEEVARAIEDMVIRGAPAIGVAAAMGIALGMYEPHSNTELHFQRTCERMAKTRPTAVNLFWAIERMNRKFEQLKDQPLEAIQSGFAIEAQKIYTEVS